MTTWTTDDNPIKAKRRENEDRWANMPVHPAAEKQLPMMSDAEIAELAKDIEANGLQVPFVVLRDNSTAPQGGEPPYPEYLLDGRCRREALKLLGIKHPNHVRTGQGGHEEKVRYYDLLTQVMTLGSSKPNWVRNVDPEAFVLSLNIKRRHLTPEQRHAAILALIEQNPLASNRKIAQQAGVGYEQVRNVRANDRNQSKAAERQPIERAKAALREHPEKTNAELTRELGIGRDTASRARNQLVEAGEIEKVPAAGPKPKPKPKADVPKPKPAAPKPSPAEKAAALKAAKITEDISAFAVLAEQLRNEVKTLAKHSLTEAQRATIRDIAKDMMTELRTLPTTITQE